MSKQFMAIIAAIVLVFVGILVLSGHKSKTGGSSNSSTTLTQHVEGQGTAGVTLVEYADYECPYCEEYFPVLKQVQTEFNTQIKFQFRNFPLVSIHQNAFAGARAAEAASVQGKFWEMHDALYDQTNWQVWTTATDPNPDFVQYATQLGLNVTQFKTDFASSKVNDLINADIAQGNKLNVQGTPAFFLDGKAVQPGINVAAFEKIINAEIANKQPKTQGQTQASVSGAGTTTSTGTTATTPTATASGK